MNRYKILDKLVQGKNYKFEDLDSGEIVDAEYRGLDIEEDYLLFWIHGNTCATPFHICDIKLK